MKNPVSVLRTTTAIIVSLSLVGTHAFAGPGKDAFELAQNTEAQPDSTEAVTEPMTEGDVQSPSVAAETEAAAGAQPEAAETASEATEADAPAAPQAEAESETPQGKKAASAETGPEAAQEELEAQDQSEAAEAAETITGDQSDLEEPAATADQAATEANPEASGTEVQSEDGTGTAEAAAQAETSAGGSSEQEGMQAAEGQAETVAEPDAAEVTESDQPAETGNQQSTEEQGAIPTQEATGEAQSSPEKQATEQPVDTEQTASEADGLEQAEDEQPIDEAQAVDAGEPAPATDSEDRQQAAEGQDPAETVEQVSEESIQEATSAGEDVVVEDETTAEELEAQLEELRQKQADLEVQLQDAEAIDAEEEVITEETSRAATEEVRVDDDDDDNDVWKYLGAAAAGAAVGALVPALGGRLVQDEGDRVIVERGGEFFVRKDENALLRQPGSTVQTEEFQNGLTRTTFTREDGSRIVTVRNDGGFILRRTRILPDGQEIVLLEQTPEEVYAFDDWDDVVPQQTTHRAESVDYSRADDEDLRQALAAQPVWMPERAFPLQAVRESVEVRSLVPAIDLPINFTTGSAAIRETEIDDLAALGRMISSSIEENPREIFLVEGHTDAVGSNLSNLALSDRRAEAVALALTQYFDIPPENLVVQGYGERYLKEKTEAASAVNRRATVRRITPLIDQVAER